MFRHAIVCRWPIDQLADFLRDQPLDESVVKQKEAERKDNVVQEGVVPRQNNSDLKRRDDAEASDAKAAGQEQGPAEHEFDSEREADRGGVEPVRQMLDVPSDPGGQRRILVVIVHGREVAPGTIAAEDFDDAGLEVNAKPDPQKQKLTGARRRMRAPDPREDFRWRQEKREKSRRKQHAVGLVAGEILRGSNEKKKA